MSQELINLRTKINRADHAYKTQNAKQNYWASDDVHRIAMRRPTLHQTKVVPQIGVKLFFPGGHYE